MQMNMLSFDVEDSFQILYRDTSGKTTPPTQQVVVSTEQILGILKRHNTKGTFFILGTVAEAFPNLVKQIADQGHEIATHGHTHRFVSSLSQDEFDYELKTSLSILRKLSGQPVVGHRAPAFSIDAEGMEWAFETMRANDILYDSSIVKQFDASQPSNAKPFTTTGGIIEVPMPRVSFGVKQGLIGGSYLRLFPYSLIRSRIKQSNSLDANSLVYMHPYEFDTYQFDSYPMTFDYSGVPIKQRVETRVAKIQRKINRSKSAQKLASLITEFKFFPIATALQL